MVLEDVTQVWQRQQFFRCDFQCLGQRNHGRVGWSEYCERTFTAQRVYQACSTYCRLEQRVVFAVDDDVNDSGRLRGWWYQYGIDHVNNAIVSSQICYDDLCVIDEDTVSGDAYGYVLSQQGFDHLTVAQISCIGFCTHNVVLKNISQPWVSQQLLRCHLQGLHQGFERCVGRCEYCERTFTAQRIHQASSTNCRFEQGVVFAVHDDVNHSRSLRSWRQQDCIDYVHHAVVGREVSDDDLCVIDEYAVGCDANGNVFSNERFDHLTVRQISCVRLRTYNVVLENVTEVGQCQQVFSGDFQRLCQCNDCCVSRSEHCERTFTAQRIHQACCTYCCFEQGVIFAVYDDVNNRRCRWRRRQQNRVNDVHHAIVRGNVSYGYLRVVDENAVGSDAHCHVFTEQGLNHLAVGQVRGVS